jgi:PAS domain S-box-containing protein
MTRSPNITNPVAASRRPPAAGHEAARPRLLVVEDDHLIAAALQRKLADLGYAVAAHVTTGDEAVARATALRPDLVLMDVQLAGPMDGIEAATRIRPLDVPVVYLTAHADAATLTRAKGTESYGYILKPCDDRELHLVIEVALYKHRTDRLLRQREQWLAATLQSIGDGVIATDADLRVTYLNPVAEQLTGWRVADAIGQHVAAVFRVVDETTREPAEVPVARALREGVRTELAHQTILLARDGREAAIDDCAAPLIDNGRVIGTVLVFRDFTAHKWLESQLHQAQKLEAIGRLAGGVAHDFNNIMTVVLGYGELLLRALAPDDPRADMVRQMRQNGERAAALTRQLLAFSRQQILQTQALDLNALLADMHQMLGRLVGERVTLATESAPGLSAVRADPVQLQQVLLNLVVNARDAMPDGGTLTLRTGAVTVDASRPRGGLAPGAYIALTVADTGCGMTDEVKAHIFEPFFTTKPFGQGSGLGLATAYGIVAQSGGTVEVESRVGHGTTFTVLLPAVDATTPPPAPPVAPAPALRGTETVLIVEDEPTVRMLTRRILEMWGYHVLEAGDGDEALGVARAHDGPIHLLATDLMMPRMSGRELASHVRTLRPDTRVLFLTGYSDEILDEDPDVAVIEKPFAAEALARRVRQVLDG